MDDLADASAALRAEWDNEAGILSDIGDAFTDMDTALAGEAPRAAFSRGHLVAAE